MHLKPLPALLLTVVLGGLPLSGSWAAQDGQAVQTWRVTGIGADQALQARMGPGAEYPTKGVFGAQEPGLRQITCVPLVPPGHTLSAAQRQALPERWCLMTHGAGHEAPGWVPARFLAAEDSSPAGVTTTGNASVDGAIALVRRLYKAEELARRGAGPSPLDPEHMGDFLSSFTVQDLQGQPPPQADLLYNAPTLDGKVLRVYADPDMPMYHGLIMVNADFTQAGRNKRATFHLRHDTGRPGAPVRMLDFPVFSDVP